MAAPLFDPPVPPRPAGISFDTEARVLEASMGDGYEQRAADGLNTVRDSLPVEWPPMDREDADEIVDFFRARAGHEAFQWTAPGASGAQLWKCPSWSKAHVDGPLNDDGSGGYWSVRATFTEVFDIV